jgi:hypothetical protein
MRRLEKNSEQKDKESCRIPKPDRGRDIDGQGSSFSDPGHSKNRISDRRFEKAIDKKSYETRKDKNV